MEQWKQMRRTGSAIFEALLAAYVMTAVLLLGLAFLMLKLSPDAGTTERMILGVYVLSCFAGGILAGRRAERMKFLHGLLTGALYFALLLLFSGLGERELRSDLLHGILAGLFCIGGGMLGGMLA